LRCTLVKRKIVNDRKYVERYVKRYYEFKRKLRRVIMALSKSGVINVLKFMFLMWNVHFSFISAILCARCSSGFCSVFITTWENKIARWTNVIFSYIVSNRNQCSPGTSSEQPAASSFCGGVTLAFGPSLVFSSTSSQRSWKTLIANTIFVTNTVISDL